MRVIIWGINYAPEPTGIAPYTTELAEFLQGRGLEVEVVTAFAYYPAWQKTAGDRGRWYRRDDLAGVRVHRCWQYVPRRLGTATRILHELSFGLTSLWRTLVLRRADVYVVVSPPLGLGLFAWLVTRCKGSRYLFHVQDLQPDSAAGLGMVRAGVFLRLMYAVERFAYRGAAGVSGISPGMIDAFAAKRVPASKTFLLPNWLRHRPQTSADPIKLAAFRTAHRVPSDALLAVYSGNVGRKQGLEVLLDAAEILAADAAGRPIVLIIAGDGAGQLVLAERLRQRPLTNVRLLSLLPAAEYQVMLSAADLALVTQMPGTGQVCFPSKLLSVLAAGLPVITAADVSSDLARAVHEGGFGLNVPAADATALAAALREAAVHPARLREWAERTSWVERFSPELMLQKFEQAVRTIGNGGKSPAGFPPAARLEPELESPVGVARRRTEERAPVPQS